MMLRKTFAASLVSALLFVAAGCTATRTTASGRPFDLPSEQIGIKPVQIFITLGSQTDSHGNGFPDTIPAILYLFPDERESRLPVWAEGSFHFELFLPNGEMIGRWVFPPEMVAKSRRKLAPGPGYSFFLRLTPGDDAIPATIVSLRSRFSGEDGVEITGGVMSLRIGRGQP